jgi:Flp pilus assembly protein TadD
MFILDHVAELLATCEDNQYRDGQRAYELVERYQQLWGDTVQANALLAAACAELGDFERAVNLQQLVAAKRKDCPEHQTRLDCYRARQAWSREPPSRHWT